MLYAPFVIQRSKKTKEWNWTQEFLSWNENSSIFDTPSFHFFPIIYLGRRRWGGGGGSGGIYVPFLFFSLCLLLVGYVYQFPANWENFISRSGGGGKLLGIMLIRACYYSVDACILIIVLFSMGFSLFTIYAYTFCFTVPCRHADRMGSLQIPAGPSRLIPTWLIYELFSLCSLQFGSFS